MKVFVIVVLCTTVLFGQILYEEHFTGGAMQLDWHPWWTDSLGIGDSMSAINDPSTPGGDDWAGRISNEYMTVAGLTYAGASDLTDYSIEAWIYTVVSASLGPYNGIAIRMDPATQYYYRLVSDFDNDARIRLGLIASGGYPVALRDWTGGDIPGGVPGSSSWHKLALKMIGDSIWCYYDDVELPDCPIVNDSVAQGYFGVYTFSMMDTASTKSDDIIVTAEPTGVAEFNNPTKGSFAVFPNPFRNMINIVYNNEHRAEGMGLVIYDASGRLVRNLSLLTSDFSLSTSVLWDGRDAAGHLLAPGVYFITDESRNCLAKVVKLQ